MTINNDIKLDIATAHSRMAKQWTNKRVKWSALLECCGRTTHTGETAGEYARMTKEEQSNIKDVGGFVGGYLSGGKRKNANLLFRTLVTLDIDRGKPETWDDFTRQYKYAACLYSTHKHSGEHPRYRLVLPLARQVTPAEYEPLCRKIAAAVGIDQFDETSYELARLFYWPSTSKGAEFVFKYQDGPVCDPDAILSEYVDYRDVSAWPMSEKEGAVVVREMKKAGDPTEKKGIVGAFCRAYGIEEAIHTFLSDKYERTVQEGRYTYRLGSVAGGLVCYDGKFAYSHHETDPAGRKLCNAFDLCRIHLFGAWDEGSRVADITRLPSYEAMSEMAAADKGVKKILSRERRQSASDDFDGITEADEEERGEDWRGELEYTKSGKLLGTYDNIILILENDPALKGKLKRDTFSGSDFATGPLPWREDAGPWRDCDDANLRVWLEGNYGITGKDKINDALTAVLTRHSFHPIRQYLDGLTWDGTPRLDRIIIDYIGAEDTELTRAMSRKHFTAAVARVFNPGCKYDYCLILAGPEGIRKSTLLSVMGGKWFSDSVTTMEGKEGMEQLRRAWIIELGELSGFKRSDVEQVKAFLSKQVDSYRAAYARRVTEIPRQCVFCGTTNEKFFLKGDTGNRRFWVVPVSASLRKYEDCREAIIRDRDQLWAEAVHYYKSGEALYLPDRLEKQAKQRQDEFNDDSDDPTRPLLLKYLDTRLPADWSTRDLQSRRQWLKHPDPLDAEGVEKRERVCVPEFLGEMMGVNMTDKEYKYKARKVARMMADLPGWEKLSTTRHAEALYGIQKGFKRKNNDEDYEDL